MSNLERIPTGIKGLDELIEGGIPRGYSVVLIGGSGTGKTILGSQILYNRIKAGEKAMIVTFETSEDKIKNQWDRFNWDYDSLKNKKQLFTLSATIDYDVLDILEKVKKTIKENNIRFLLIDSVDMIFSLGRRYDKRLKELDISHTEGLPIAGYELNRSILCALLRMIESIPGITPLFIAEADLSGENLSKTGVPEYECDGIIMLEMNFAMKNRSLSVIKMRQTKHDFGKNIFEITSDGIIVQK
jgi:KaiC/GvpD/RAD55 family RecA-like ATPase